MTNPNPIKYSDLITPDNAINELIAQLDKAIAKYEELRSKIASSASDLAKSMTGMSGATEEQRENISALAVESEKLAKSYEQVNAAERQAYREKQKITQAQKEQERIDKLIVQLQKSKEGSYNRLSAQYRLNKIRLNEMSAAERMGTDAGRQLERETKAIYEQMSNLQKATGKYTLEVGHYENALRGLPGPLGMVLNAFTQMGTSIKGLANSDLPAATKALKGFSIVAAGLVGVFVLLARSLTGSVKKIAEFEQANANLSTILGTTREGMKELTDSAQSLGRTTEYTASQVTELQTALAKLGFNQSQILGMQKSILQFATAVGANLGDAAEVAGATLRAFNLTSADTEKVLATLAVATNNSALNFEKIRTSIGTVFPVANAFGLSVTDTTALLGALANAGFDASTAATATRNILLNLADANGKLAQKLGGSARTFDDIFNALVKLKNEGINLAEALDITDKRSVAAFTSFLSGAESAQELRASLEDVDGELERIQSQRLDTLEGSTLLLKSAWEGLTLAFSESTGPMSDVVQWLTKVIQKTQELLFPAQTAESNYFDQWTKSFQNFVKKMPDTAADAMDAQINAIRKRLAQAQLELDNTPAINAIGVAQRSRRVEQLEAELKGAERARKSTLQLMKDQEAERQAAAERQIQEEKDKQDKLTKEQQKAAKKAAQQRLKDRQAVIDSINFEIATLTEGTQEMLDKRLDKIDAERALELERNRQKVETERKDEAVINAKYDADKIKARKDFDKKVAELAVQRLQAEQQSIQLQLAVTEKGTQEELALRLAAIKKAEEIEIQQNNAKAEAVRQSEKAIHDKYNKQYLDTEAKFYGDLAKRDLEASQQIAESQFNQERHNERERTIFRINQEIGRLKKLLELDEKFFKMMTEQEKKAIRENINELEGEKKRLGYDNIFELLGIDVDDEQQKSISQALDAAKELASSLVDMWKQAADEARSSADAQVEAAKKALEAEVEARRQGYASKEEEARKELALAKSTQAAAIEEQRKAQKAQESIDTLTQASSLVTASANLWKTLSELSPVAALAGIAVMWASFGASKIRAAQLTRSEQYGEGTVELLQGGSHASGHDIDLGTKSDGTKRRAEGGEYFAVINKRNSRKYGSLIPEVINSLNNGTFSERFARAGDQMAGAVLALGNTSADVSRLERDVKAIREQGAERRFTDGHGNVVIRYKNLTRKIKS